MRRRTVLVGGAIATTEMRWVCAGGPSWGGAFGGHSASLTSSAFAGGAPAPHRVKILRSESPPSFRRKREKKGGAPVLLFQLLVCFSLNLRLCGVLL